MFSFKLHPIMTATTNGATISRCQGAISTPGFKIHTPAIQTTSNFFLYNDYGLSNTM